MTRNRFTRSLPVVALALAACTQVAEDPGSASPALATSADERHLIAINGYPVDTQYPERTYGQLPSALRRGDLSGAIRQGLAPSGGLYLIQLDGPVRDEALAELRATGVELVSYIPFNAYVIRADSRAAAALVAARLPSVQFMGDYEPGFRIAPELRGAPARSLLGSTVDLTVQVVAGPNAQATLDALGALALDFRGSSEVLNFHNVQLTVPTQQVDAIASMRDVFAVEPRTERRRLDEAQGQIVAGNLSGNQASGPGYLAWLNGKGFTSSQFTSFAVGVTDDAYSLSGHPDLPSGRIAFQNNPTSQTGAQGGHGFLNAHIIGGLNTGTGAAYEDSRGHNYGLGIAPYARVGVTAIFGSGSATATSWESTAYGQGARISSNSWGYTGTSARRYDANAQEFDRIVRDAQTTAGLQQMTVVFAAGNDGSGSNTVASPATAKNIISVGAGENDRQTGSDGCGIGNTGADSANDIISFSSRGPVNSTGGDGRVKPDLMAPGTHVEAGIPQSNYDGSSVCNQYWPSGQTLYGWSSGTSHSCPAVAGGAALVYQDFLNKGLPAPSPAMVKGVLMATAQHMTGVGANDTLPSNNQGMGRMNLGRAFDGASRILVDQTQVLGATGATHSVSGTITSTSLPFRVTLAWTDAPGPTTGAPWVNNLDLEVTVNGTLYRGNVFSGASSVTGGTADVKNNVESVFLPAGASGNFTVTVKATNIAGDGVPGNSDTTDQDFALVIYNGSAGGGTSPTIGVSPSSLSFSATAGGSNPASQTLSISNTGGGTLTWSASDNATWLTLSPTSGTAPSTATVSASISGLAAGTYNGTITITATGATNSPVSVPVTLTVSGGGGGGGTAVFDSALQAPKCATAGSSCDTGTSLVLGRANLGPEPNQPNTINDSCADGTSGTFHVDESVDQVTVTSVDGTSFAAGKQVRVDVKVWAYSTFSSDKLDLYYAANASSPSWTLIGTLSPTAAGAQTLSATYTLPSGSLQAVRAAFRYSGSASPCASGGYNDRDDLVFAVGGGGGGGAELVTNGGFEGSASPWVLSGQAAWSGSGGSPHSGSGVLHLGNANSTTGTTYQTLSIPTSATGDLSFWLNVTSSETTTSTQYDRLYVEVRNTSGTLLATLGTFSNLNKGTLGVYSQKSFSLAAYRGQTVRLQFRATNDVTLPTMFRVDDVSVQ